MNSALKEHIENVLSEKFSFREPFSWTSVNGGSINETYKTTVKNSVFFVKSNVRTVFTNGFKEEVLGLRFLKENKAKVPEIIAEGNFHEDVFLVLDWVTPGAKDQQFWIHFGHQLARLHQNKYHSFGLDHDNFMGQLHQSNSWKEKFTDFFIENRLEPQIKLAFDSKLLSNKQVLQFQSLYHDLQNIFPSERPSAVHGDLWNGNFMCTSNKNAVFIDPAVYWGHREIDLAMTSLFGGFSNEFYESYFESYPIEKGFMERKNYYNLYPLLIHLNLFGGSYLRAIEQVISKF